MVHVSTSTTELWVLSCSVGASEETYFDGFLPLLKLAEMFPLLCPLSECQSGFKSLLV